MKRSFRVLVTGSRDWPGPKMVHEALDDARRALPADEWFEFVVVHGACPTGADLYTSQWVRSVWERDDGGIPVREERHHALWNTHGKAAGPIRNQRMVDLGADIYLAFILNDSRGTTHCLERARKAGISGMVYREYMP